MGSEMCIRDSTSIKFQILCWRSSHSPTNASSIHSGAHLHVPAVSNLHSTAAARSWIRSVSHPEKSLNSGVHWNNEIEPLIKEQVVVVLKEFV